MGAVSWGFGWLRRGESIHAANLEHAVFLALLPWAAGLTARLTRHAAPSRSAVCALALLASWLVPLHPGLALIYGAWVALAGLLALVLAGKIFP